MMTTRDKLYSVIAVYGVICYVVALTAVSLLWHDFALRPLWMAWGLGAVAFFFLTTWAARRKADKPTEKKFMLAIFLTALAIRVVYVVAIGYYYYYQNGDSFEYDAADSHAYNDLARYLALCIHQGAPLRYVLIYLHNAVYPMGFSDQGFTLWLTLLYTIFGRNNLLIPRLFNALMDAYVCVAIYKLASRSTDSRTARLSAIICVFMPTMIHYTGLHLKESTMLFVTVMAIERTDYLIRSRRYNFVNIAASVFFTALIFGFRTVLGVAVLASYVAFIIFAPSDVISRKARIVATTVVAVVAVVFLLTFVGREMGDMYRLRFKTLGLLSEKYEKIGLRHAELAQNRYLAPGVFVFPLSTLTEVGNSNQKMMTGDTYVKNFLAFFVMWAFVVMTRRKEWRNFSLVGAFAVAYAGILALSCFVMSERYHFPLLPFYAIMAAYTLTHFRRKDFPFFYAYCTLLVAVLVAWNFLKLSARGLV